MTIEDVFYDGDERMRAMSDALKLPELFNEITQASHVTMLDTAEAYKDDYETLLKLQHDILLAINELKQAYDVVEERSLRVMPEVTMVEGVVADDGRELEIVKSKGGSSQGWKHHLLWPKMTEQIVDLHPEVFYDPDTGVRRDPDTEARLLVEQVQTCVTANWKKGDTQRGTKGLRDLKINPNRYSTYKEGKAKVQFIPQAKEE